MAPAVATPTPPSTSTVRRAVRPPDFFGRAAFGRAATGLADAARAFDGSALEGTALEGAAFGATACLLPRRPGMAVSARRACRSGAGEVGRAAVAGPAAAIGGSLNDGRSGDRSGRRG